ncbi:MAG: NAD(P)-dependent alcohol dehydrogenase [Pseudazoarcus pumilus]|nr:NAD(P)-dependent alcohol dehydrogenase [Pseudazoarcus pumilus]
MSRIRAWAAQAAGQPLVPFEYDPGPLAADDVEIEVENCGICHSDLSVLNNEWMNSVYPVVPGHEIVGRIKAVGSHVRHLRVGQRVGVGWASDSCMHCHSCMSGDHNLCNHTQAVIIGHYGGFAERVRANAAWTIPLPEGLDAASVGPLLCGGVTVFTPFVEFGVKPTHRVGVVGIGGLGHMAVKFARAWGCEVTAFTSSPSKFDEARSFGAHHVVSSRDSADLARLAGKLDFLLVTVNVSMDWNALVATLAPKGRLHVVGAVLEPIPVNAFDLIGAQRSISGSPIGSPATIATMLDFAARHSILPQVERFPMSRVNEALAHLESGKARYRIVLDADFA